MKVDLPYRRRTASVEPTSVASAPAKESRWTDLLRSGAASFFGASLASIFTLWITLGTLESFKAEENLRELALNDLYRPIIKATSECTANKHQLMNSLAMFEGQLKLASGYLEEFSSNPRSSEIRDELMPTSDTFSRFIENVGKTIEEVGKHTSSASSCDREIMDNWMTLAIVLGVDREFSDLATARLKLMSDIESPIRDEDMIIQWITKPKTGISMLLAASDGMSGNKSRSASLFAKFTSELKKSSDHASKVYKQHEDAYIALIKLDNEINRLFLKNLRGRFSITPTTLLQQKKTN